MYLKKLEVFGFKSFADKVCVDFNDGITSVVGPNGSGKSNISDSIRWVLGEQSAKSLRGGKMEDVIFAGTQHRKPLGFAEVSLTIDNQKNILPLPFSEVTVTRRVYRSGESEFLINKSPCRLKDIHELFMDTGIGKDGYSIIGQGRVDEILSTRSEDRRAIFEEASGITKYKVRKHEAERKLESTETNLIRINDIVTELQAQLEPLEGQSENARKYLNYRDTLKELEVNVFLENILRSKEKLEEIDANVGVIENNISQENEKLTEKTNAHSETLNNVKSLEEELEALTKSYYDQETALERYNSDINVNTIRISTANNSILRLKDEISGFYQKNTINSAEINSIREKIQTLSQKLEADTIAYKKADDDYNTLILSMGDNERNLELLNKSLIDKMSEQTELKLRLSNNKNNVENLRERNANINSEINQVELDRQFETQKQKDITTSLKDINSKIVFHKERQKKLFTEQDELKKRLYEEEKKLNQLRNEVQIKGSRKKMLQNMEANLEGYFRSVREIMKECERNVLFSRGIHGALGKLIEVPAKNATALEMSLGGALQNIVTATEEDAKRAITYLKRSNLGRATFLPLTSVKGKRLDSHIVNEVSKMDGFVGVASDLITYKNEYEGIILYLLGKVVIMRDLDSAIQVARKYNYSFRIVTLDGDVLSTSGSMAGGSNESKDSGILNRSAEITDISKEVDKLIAQDKVVNVNIEDIKSMLLEIEVDTQEVMTSLRNDEYSKIREESSLQQINETIYRLETKLSTLNQDKDSFFKIISDADSQISFAYSEITRIEKEINETRIYIAKNQDNLKVSQSSKDTCFENVTELKITISSVKENIENLSQMLQRYITEQDSISQSITIRTDELIVNANEIEKLTRYNEETAQKITIAEDTKYEKSIQIEKNTKTKAILDESTRDIINVLQQINQNIHLLSEELGRLLSKKSKFETELESVQNRLWEEYELTFSNALPLKKDIENMAIAARQINELRSSIRSLGPVNISAIEEYSKTKERHDFLKTQKEDLENAKDNLRKVIEEMTIIMKKQFLEQFELINLNFNRVFRELFNGGNAEIILTDKNNVLESGIEIEVQPPGKKLQNMMLLSGGERAFTAIALLFAILKLRPAPFCLLDEIEAALDDANVYKFAQYIRQHTELTQFLVITHRKGTMEASDSLYGITMQEQGVSNIVSLKMNEN